MVLEQCTRTSQIPRFCQFTTWGNSFLSQMQSELQQLVWEQISLGLIQLVFIQAWHWHSKDDVGFWSRLSTITRGISYGKKFQIVINLLGQKPDFPCVWSKFSYFLISRSGFFSSYHYLVHIHPGPCVGPEDLLRTCQIINRDLKFSGGECI